MLRFLNPVRTAVRLLPILALIAAGPLTAQAGHGTVNTNAAGVALQGYDPVAFFTDGKPVQGSTAHMMTHNGVAYQFASAAHRNTFAANPAKYLPAYGGYCAMGVAIGKKLDADPMLWRIVDGKLYLNVNADAQQMWLKGTPKHIASADERWQAVASRKGYDKM